MSFKAHVTGHFLLTNETTNANKVDEDLSELFTTITGAIHKHADDLPLISTDGQKDLPLGTLAGIRTMLIWPEGGTVTFRHDTNANGILLTGMMLVQGVLTAPTVETSSTSTMTVHYVIVE